MKFQYASGSRPLEGYTIKRGIGRGGFGEVYFATSDAGKELALKHVERNLEVELRGVSQCLNLKHVNLIDLYDVRYDEQGDAWVVMEYVGGPSLKDVCDRNPNGLPLDEVNRWFRGLAAGVAYLHDHGIVHRDLKPGNIFDDEGVVKIGDYGLSKFISTSRRSGQTESVGTFHYMAPEIGKGVYGKEIDVYALGIMLFEMITGRVPFEGESSQEIIMKHLTADPDLTGVPQPYRGVIQRALQKDPDKRFSNVAEMQAALEGGSKNGKSQPPLLAPAAFASPLPPKLAAATFTATAEPLYIGADDEGIEFGPLHETPLPAQPPQGGPRLPATSGSRLPEEPVAKAIGRGWGRLAQWWNQGPLTTPLKIGLLIVAAVAGIFYGGWMIPLVVGLGCLYLVYLGIRLLAQAIASLSAVSGPSVIPTPTQIAPENSLPRSTGWQSLSWEQRGRQFLGMKTAGDRIAELTGSMLVASLVAAVLAVAIAAIGGDSLVRSANPLAGPAWIWLVTTLGAWLVLAAGKVFERSKGEELRRRFVFLVLGLAFGASAFAANQFLMVAMSPAPKITEFLAYFGAIFLTVGWWKQTDPLRASRLQIGPIVIAMIAAWCWHLLWHFPQPWGFLVAGAISIAVQLSAPWLSPQQRVEAGIRGKRARA